MSTIKLKPFSSNPEEVYRIELLAEKLNAALVKVFRHRKVCSSVKAYNVEDLAKGIWYAILQILKMIFQH